MTRAKLEAERRLAEAQARNLAKFDERRAAAIVRRDAEMAAIRPDFVTCGRCGAQATDFSMRPETGIPGAVARFDALCPGCGNRIEALMGQPDKMARLANALRPAGLAEGLHVTAEVAVRKETGR